MGIGKPDRFARLAERFPPGVRGQVMELLRREHTSMKRMVLRAIRKYPIDGSPTPEIRRITLQAILWWVEQRRR